MRGKSHPHFALMMKQQKYFRSYIPPMILAVSTLCIYLTTMAPGLTWANDGVDGGDLITAAATGGVPHPTGYPAYLLIARLFQMIPLGNLAYRTNLLSALATVLAALFIYFLVIRSLSPTESASEWQAGLLAGYAYSFSPIVWSQAVITEVYSLHAFFILLILYLVLYPPPFLSRSSYMLDAISGLVMGLAMGNHLTTILLVPGVLLVSCIKPKTDPTLAASPARSGLLKNMYIRWDSLSRILLWFGIGCFIYLILPLRAMNQPSLNWGNPVTIERFWWLVSGQLYQTGYLQITPIEFMNRIQPMVGTYLQQFGVAGLIFGILGLILYFKPNRLYLLLIWMIFSYSTFSCLYSSQDSYVYLIPAIIAFAICIGLGIGGLRYVFVAKAKVLWVNLIVLAFIYIFVFAISHWKQVDASQDFRAEEFGRETVESLPGEAIVFLQGDKAVFTLWYYHNALHERADIILIATDLLQYDWYQEVLISNYPSLILSVKFPTPQTISSVNLGRPHCYVKYFQTGEMNCVGENNPY